MAASAIVDRSNGRLAMTETPGHRSPRSRQHASALAGSAGAQGYPDRIIEIDRPLHAGLLGRHPGPRPGRQHGGAARPALRRAQQAGRQRHPRHRRGRARQARRLHADAWRRVLDHRAAADRAADRLHRRNRSTPICQTFKNDQVIVARPGHLQDPGRHHRGEQGQARRPELRQSGPRHDPASVDGRAVADHQGRVQPRAVQGTGRVDPDDAWPARSISRWRR